MVKQCVPPLSTLARLSDPFADEQTLVKRLRSERQESRHLEWKLTVAVGESVPPRVKYRTVKAVVSFANTQGGFVVFGVDPSGKWVGIDTAALSQMGSASLAELFNSCVCPEITFTYRTVAHKGRQFGIIHVPSSPLMPHVVVKDVFDHATGTRRPILLAKYAIYCRYAGKSDLASPTHIERIIARRTESLRTEILRRVKHVRVPIPVAQPHLGETSVYSARVTRVTKDPGAPPTRLTRDPGEADGVLLHEQLSDGLFDEINNVIAANALLTKSRLGFVLGAPVYYRIYAEREHVRVSDAQIEGLARAGLLQFYAPALHWLLMLPPAQCGLVINAFAEEPRSPNVHGLLRLVVLLGPEVCAWLRRKLDLRWGKSTQRPEYYWTFERMCQQSGRDRRMLALRMTEASRIEFSGRGQLEVGDILNSHEAAAAALSEACMSVFEGHKDNRTACRQLDVLAYGRAIEAKSAAISRALIDLG